jgi:monoterpene epsilon-lactone hydrolase
MAITPQLEVAKQMFVTMRKRSPELGTLDGTRLALDEMLCQFPLGSDVVYESINAGGVPAEWISIENQDGSTSVDTSDERVMMYLHGGGYVLGSRRAYRGYFSRVSRAAGTRVLGLDYRLAPEFPFPAAVDDSVAAYRWLLSQGIAPGHIVIGGDSTGGGLAIATLVALRYLGEPLPAGVACVSPWVDGLRISGQRYIGDLDWRAPLALPLYADLRGLPPLLIQVGTAETLLDDSTRLADQAESSRVKVELSIWEDMIHVWPIFAPVLPEGQQAIERIGKFVREQTK